MADFTSADANGVRVPVATPSNEAGQVLKANFSALSAALTALGTGNPPNSNAADLGGVSPSTTVAPTQNAVAGLYRFHVVTQSPWLMATRPDGTPWVSQTVSGGGDVAVDMSVTPRAVWNLLGFPASDDTSWVPLDLNVIAWGSIIGNIDDQTDLSDRLNALVLKSGDTMTGQLTLPGGGTGSQAITVSEAQTLVNTAPADVATWVIAKPHGSVVDADVAALSMVDSHGNTVHPTPGDIVTCSDGINLRLTTTDYAHVANWVQAAIVTTTSVSEGTNLYFTTARVLTTVLTGWATTAWAAITNTDTVATFTNKAGSALNTIMGTGTDGMALMRRSGATVWSAIAKGDVGLGNVDNTSDVNKPVSTAQAAADALKAPLISPALTGTPTVPTASPLTNNTQAASTAYVDAAVVVGGGVPTSGGAYRIPTVTANAVTNGTNLLAAYTAAAALTPNGAALSANNRAAVMLLPGKYDIGTSTLSLTAEFVDVIGLSSNSDDVFITGAATVGATILQSANDVVLANFSVTCTHDGYPSHGVYTCTSTNSSTIRKNVNIVTTLGGISLADYGANAGLFENCRNTGGLGFHKGQSSSATYNNCTSLTDGFGKGGTCAGVYNNCSGVSFASFDSFYGAGVISGKLNSCIATTSGFGASGTFSGNPVLMNCITLGGGGFALTGGTLVVISGCVITGSGSFPSYSGQPQIHVLNCVNADGSSTGNYLSLGNGKAQVTSAYTVKLADLNTCIVLNSSTPFTVTVDASVLTGIAGNVGVVAFRNVGSGVVTLTAAGGTTLTPNPSTATKTIPPGGSATVTVTSTSQAYADGTV